MTHVIFGSGKELYNSSGSYSLQCKHELQGPEGYTYKVNPSPPFWNARENIPQGNGNQRSNWPFGAGFGVVPTFEYNNPAAYQMPNRNNYIRYWDKLPLEAMPTSDNNQQSPFLSQFWKHT